MGRKPSSNISRYIPILDLIPRAIAFLFLRDNFKDLALARLSKRRVTSLTRATPYIYCVVGRNLKQGSHLAYTGRIGERGGFSGYMCWLTLESV